jgi:hypothetical protein
MLKSLKSWRDQSSSNPLEKPAKKEPSLLNRVLDSGWVGQGSTVANAPAKVKKRNVLSRRKARRLHECGYSKDDFFEAVVAEIEAQPVDEKVFSAIEKYFERFGTPSQLDAWDWALLDAEFPEEGDFNLKNITRNTMTQAAVRMVGLVLTKQLPGAAKLSLREQLERAEWSLRRGEKTLFKTKEEALARHRVGPQAAIG